MPLGYAMSPTATIEPGRVSTRAATCAGASELQSPMSPITSNDSDGVTRVVGAAVVGAAVVGARVVGAAVVGARVVGAAVVARGREVVVGAVAGAAVEGRTGVVEGAVANVVVLSGLVVDDSAPDLLVDVVRGRWISSLEAVVVDPVLVEPVPVDAVSG